jgi:uroporphyrinogen decarboxylase
VSVVSPILENPEPDFDKLVRVLNGEEEAKKVHQVELVVDGEILQAVQERYLDRKWIPCTGETKEAYIEQIIRIHYLLGYDFVTEGVWRTVWQNHPPLKSPSTEDTAGELARAQREWANEGRGIITSWETFERFPWDEITVDYSPYAVMARHLPDGMKIAVSSCVFEHVLEHLLGYEGLFYLIHDEPDLVAEVFSRWGQKVYDYYRNVVDMEAVGAIFHADDLGFKTSIMLRPEDLRKHVFPWFKKFVDLAHEHGKPYWYHCCGNLYDGGVIEDIIKDVGIDGLHSFEKVIIDPRDFKQRYGSRIAMMGGVDMDNLSRMNEPDLRQYVRDLLETCMPNRFALGSGNTVANYVPVDNYVAMLDEARRFTTTV